MWSTTSLVYGITKINLDIVAVQQIFATTSLQLLFNYGCLTETSLFITNMCLCCSSPRSFQNHGKERAQGEITWNTVILSESSKACLLQYSFNAIVIIPSHLHGHRQMLAYAIHDKVHVPQLGYCNLVLYLSGMWLGVALRTDTKRTCVWKRLDCMLRI